MDVLINFLDNDEVQRRGLPRIRCVQSLAPQSIVHRRGLAYGLEPLPILF